MIDVSVANCSRVIRWPALLAERELPGKRYHPVSVELTPEDCESSVATIVPFAAWRLPA